MKNKKMMKLSAGLFSAVMLLGSMPSVTILADTPDFGWYEENGGRYWYENGIRQGTEGRGKEIYDPSTDAWYWLDAVDNGKVAAGKDVYQESWAGDYADREDGTGKWVRYDENGRMIKGWSTTDAGTYYFDLITGAMAKGTPVIDGKFCAFDWGTGIGVNCQWYEADGNKYWYEGGVRQGTEGRGKEIFDPASNAWYWLDAVDNGKMATGKDVYQESSGGKWVRYDAEGHMIKGWNEQNGKKYYFDPVTGAMAKGVVAVDGIKYMFNQDTGICEGEYTQSNVYLAWRTEQKIGYDANDAITEKTVYERNSRGVITKEIRYKSNETNVVDHEETYEYDADGNVVKLTHKSSDGYGYVTETEYVNGRKVKSTRYDLNGVKKSINEYLYEGENIVRENYYTNSRDLSKLMTYSIYTYDGNGNKTERKSYYTTDNGAGVLNGRWVYEYNADGDAVKESSYDGDGTLRHYNISTYVKPGYERETFTYDKNGVVLSGYSYEYDAKGRLVKSTAYKENKEVDYYVEYSDNQDSVAKEVGSVYQYVQKTYNADGSYSGCTVFDYKAYEYVY